jgi:hypothetical protein
MTVGQANKRSQKEIRKKGDGLSVAFLTEITLLLNLKKYIRQNL